MSMPSMTPLLSAADGVRKSAALIDRTLLEAAANWYVDLKSQTSADFDHAALERWIATSDAHRRAWDLVQQLERHLGSMPSQLALPALQGAQQRRRTALKVLTLLLTAGTAGWAAHETTPWRAWSADYKTAPGERRTITLADGGTLELNTDTALDIRYDATRRVIRLHQGEIMIRTATDNAAGTASRDFIVETRQGSIRALGTRFSVRSDKGSTLVAVFEHAVEVAPFDTTESPVRVEAGQQAVFTDKAVGSLVPLERSQGAWTRGMLIAVDQRMDTFLAELSRYKRGQLHCDPAVAAMQITGAYRLDDIDAVLESLAASHAIRVRYFTRYWVQVGPLG
ncbi:FecR domain-containing protein [Herminiimonas arsenitoxidans]|uniref:FecR domain-containing protein n=1 Tax=Herminiimonas arsenitoxidans TaxID=1809410 RepID=UPI0013902047|nr:FecR domain-containing protein [Herminiimonas arsenitoxidans]